MHACMNTHMYMHSLNAIREMCARCPLAMEEDLLHDLAEYKKAKDKSVIMAARSLIQLYREVNPALLHRKDRVRFQMLVLAFEFG